MPRRTNAQLPLSKLSLWGSAIFGAGGFCCLECIWQCVRIFMSDAKRTRREPIRPRGRDRDGLSGAEIDTGLAARAGRSVDRKYPLAINTCAPKGARRAEGGAAAAIIAPWQFAGHPFRP
jgi:hypothetical protein